MTVVEQLTPAVAEHAEGPVWSAAWGGLRWVDMHAGDVLHLDEASGAIDRTHVDTEATVIRPRSGGGMVVVGERNIHLVDGEGGVDTLDTVFDDPGIRFNEGACSPDGDLFVGTMAYAETPGAGTIYRLATDHRVSTALTGVTISNGLCWNAAGTLAYYADTPTGRIDVFDWTDGELRHRRSFVEIPTDCGYPDGLTVDDQDGVWVALWNGAAVHHYDAAGTLQDVLDLPVPYVTACTFGGEDLDRLFLTTSAVPDDAGDQAGAVFVARPGVRGVPTLPYRG